MIEVPGAAEAVGEVDEELGRAPGSVPPMSLNIFSKVGTTKAISDHHHADGHGEHDRRVDHRALDPPLQLLVLLDVGAEALQDGVEDAADLAGADQLDEEGVEDLGVLARARRRRSSRTRPWS